MLVSHTTRRLPAVLATALILAIAGTAAAEAQRVELTPLVGYRFGGEFSGEDLPLGITDVDVEVDDGASFGLLLGIAVTDSVKIELLFDRQSTKLEASGALFGPTTPLFDLDIDYYHVGAIYEWGSGDQTRYFVGGTAGATRLAPDASEFSSETKFSISVNGGVKVFVSDTVGFRFDGRFYPTFISEDDEVFCDPFGFCVRYRETTDLFQAQVNVGLIFRF